MTIDLTGKVAIVTGAGGGIGREIAETLASEGVSIAALDVKEELMTDVAAAFKKNSWQGMHKACDVRDWHQVSTVVDEIAKTYGRIDIVVNNAGVAKTGSVETMSEEVWDANIDVNLKGVFLMSKAVVPYMKKQNSGSIINAASFAAIIPRVFTAAYASSKAGVVYFTRVLAGELGPWNIRVNCYAPGMVPTEMNHYDELPEETQARLLNTLTLHRWGGKRDIANLICFLSSDLGSYITGTLIDISGGKLTTQVPEEAYQQI